MIETKVEGSPASVRAGARWLRQTLADGIDTASDRHVDARRTSAGSWEGDTGDAHRGFTGTLVRASDSHAERTRRAATAFTDYATRLENHQTRMETLRSQARGGGLTVSGTVIEEPPVVPPSVVVPGSPEEAERDRAIEKIELYDRISGDVATARENHTAWISAHLAPAQTDAEESDDLDQLMEVAKWLAKTFGTGLAAYGMRRIASNFREQRNALRHTARRSGNPARRAEAGRQLPDANRNLSRAARLARFAGPIGFGVEIGMGIYEGHQTGDYTRAAITTGASLAAGAATVAIIATAPVSVPAIAVVAAAGLVGAGASWAAGEIYDNWDDISSTVSDGWDNATDAVGDAWDAVTPW